MTTFFALISLFLSLTISWSTAFVIKSPSIQPSLKCSSITKQQRLYVATSSDKSENDKKSGILPPWFPAFGTACLGGFMFGLDIGSSSSVIRILGQGTSELGTLSSFQLGEIASGSLFGAIISSIVVALTGDGAIGRKFELQLASLLFILGTFVQSLSTDFNPELVGRLIYGLGIGIAMHVAPLFIAETSPNALRGKLISFKEAAIVGGIVMGYGSGAFFGGSENWHGVFQAALPFELLMLLGACIVPESPRWLALRNRRVEAEESLQKLQNMSSEEAKSNVDEMMKMSATTTVAPAAPVALAAATATSSAPAASSSSSLANLSELFSSPYNRRALLIGIGLVLFQQFSGQPSVLYFANRIFEQASLGFEAAVAVGVFKLIMTSVSAYLVENPNFGRKSLLLYGNVGITISLLLLSYLYYGQAHPQAAAELVNTVADGTAEAATVAGGGGGGGLQSQLGIIASMFLFVGSYQIGFGPITWLVLSEIFPLRVRSAAVSLGTLANFTSNLLITLLFEAERQALGEPLLFLQFAVIGLASVFFTSKYVFETQGLSLEEIEVKLRKEVDK